MWELDFKTLPLALEWRDESDWLGGSGVELVTKGRVERAK